MRRSPPRLPSTSRSARPSKPCGAGAVARTHMEDFDGAYSDLKAAAKLEPQVADRKPHRNS
eukprot:2862210-Karenia_brevis.AAC.1